MKREKTGLGSGAVHRGRFNARSRRSAGQLKATHRIARDLAIVAKELEEFLDPDVIRDWLLTEQFTLGNRTPVEALREGRLSEVLQTASETEHGAYV